MEGPALPVGAGASRWSRITRSLTASEWRRVAAMFAVVAALHVVGFGVLVLFVVPGHFSLGATGAFGLGLGITAYTLGLRHAFDADHIAAIDNTTRKLMTDGQRPLSIGFFFSLGHSTVVLALALVFAFGLRALGAQVESDSSTLQTVTGTIGTLVSGTFLMIIGLLNLVVLVRIGKVFRRMRRGECDEAALESQLEPRGGMYRFYGRFTRIVRKPWHMYPIGVLFGVGFDTATEIALLFLAAGAAFGGLPFYAILCLPILFAAGMSLLDTIDGAFMNFAYGWAFAQPVRKVYYNMTITGLSVAVALIVGSIELAAVTAEKLGLTGGAWDTLAGIDLNLLGYFVVGLFAVTWAGALLIWRYGHVEEKWNAALGGMDGDRPAA
jgi:nickel/cobalt transporter (NiCoT) family protein